MRLQGKNAIVTGAGSGIGRAIAIGYAREGARVVAGDIDAATVVETAETIRAAGGDAIAVPVDVAVKAEVDALFATALDACGRIHILVSVPGISTTRAFLDLPEEEWDRVVDVSLKGHYLCGQAAARHMAEHGGGAIVNISSICDEVAQANYSHYVASKGGVRMLTKAMAMELVEHGIRVNAVAPGPTDTGSRVCAHPPQGAAQSADGAPRPTGPIPARRKLSASMRPSAARCCPECRWGASPNRKKWSVPRSFSPASRRRATSPGSRSRSTGVTWRCSFVRWSRTGSESGFSSHPLLSRWNSAPRFHPGFLGTLDVPTLRRQS